MPFRAGAGRITGLILPAPAWNGAVAEDVFGGGEWLEIRDEWLSKSVRGSRETAEWLRPENH